MVDHLPIKTFKEASSLIHNGDLLFCSGDYVLSRIIRWSTSSPFSHVAFLAIWEGEIMVFEAVESDGIRVVPLKHYISNYENREKSYRGSICIGRLNPFIPSLIFQQICKEAKRLLNARYDFVDLLRIFLRLVLRIPLVRREDKSFLCSEFVERCFAVGFGKPYFFCQDVKEFVSPATIAGDSRLQMLFRIQP